MMKLKALLTKLGWVCCCLILITSCSNTENKAKEGKTSSLKQQSADNRQRGPEITETVHDPDLYFGDLGVEQLFTANRNRIRSLAEQPQLLDPHGFPLIKQSPKPSVKPIKGSYVEILIKAAKSYMGTPYIYGSDRTEPSSFDCSDFTRWVFLSSLGMDLPWDSRSQAAYVKAFSKRTYRSLKNAKRGDLLFFSNYRGNQPSDYKGLTYKEKPITHLGIYLGNGEIIHCASKKSGGVNIHKITWRQLHNRFVFGGEVVP